MVTNKSPTTAYRKDFTNLLLVSSFLKQCRPAFTWDLVWISLRQCSCNPLGLVHTWETQIQGHTTELGQKRQVLMCMLFAFAFQWRCESVLDVYMHDVNWHEIHIGNIVKSWNSTLIIFLKYLYHISMYFK